MKKFIISIVIAAMVAFGFTATTPAPASAAVSCSSIIHRAMHKNFDEEQVGGIKASAKWGWGAELDMHATKDNKGVMVHDHTYKRISGGVSNARPEDLTYAENRAIPLARGGKAIGPWDAVKAAKQSGAKLMIEIKRYNDYPELWNNGSFVALINAIKKQGMTNRVFVGGVGIAQLRKIDPTIKAYVRVSSANTSENEVAGYQLVKLLDASLNKSNVSNLKKNHAVMSARVTLSTDPDWVNKAIGMGVNNIFTNQGSRIRYKGKQCRG